MADELSDGELPVVLTAALRAAAPGLFGGDPPAVALAVAGQSLTLDTAKAPSASPGADPRLESLGVDPGRVAGPYALAAPPVPGPRQVRLRSHEAIVATLRDDETDWDDRSFTLRPRAYRSFDGVTHLDVRYGVASVGSVTSGTVHAMVTLTGAVEVLPRARALALALLTLDGGRIAASVVTSTTVGDYTTVEQARSLTLTGLDTSTSALTLQLVMEVGVETRRALRPDEGTLISRLQPLSVSLDSS